MKTHGKSRVNRQQTKYFDRARKLRFGYQIFSSIFSPSRFYKNMATRLFLTVRFVSTSWCRVQRHRRPAEFIAALARAGGLPRVSMEVFWRRTKSGQIAFGGKPCLAARPASRSVLLRLKGISKLSAFRGQHYDAWNTCQASWLRIEAQRIQR